MTSFTTLADETDVLRRLKESDEKAFTLIYEAYWKPMFHRAAARLEQFAEAEEIVQDIFLDLWNRRESLTITNGLSSYLAVSLKYRIINALAKKHRHREYLQHSRRDMFTLPSPTEATLDFEALKNELEKETLKLPEKCRLVFRLSREEGFSHKQIAAHLSISEKTVETHLTKALRHLKSGLTHLFLLCLLVILCRLH